jgi:hypothetical protein
LRRGRRWPYTETDLHRDALTKGGMPHWKVVYDGKFPFKAKK